MRRVWLILPLAFWGCGRGPVGGLSGGIDEDGSVDTGVAFDTGTALDTGVRDGSTIPDGSLRDLGVRDTGARDTGSVPDAATECQAPRDCIAAFGAPPRCPGGSRGRWLCNSGFCEADCPCASDCECSLLTACIGGACMPAGRENLCCTNPNCTPGSFCQEPGGGGGICPAPDGGVFDGGRPDFGVFDGGRRDFGVLDGFVPDLGLDLDGSIPDFGGLDGFVPDFGPFPDGSIPDIGTFDSGVAVTPVGDPCAAQGLCGPIGFCIEENLGFPGGYCSQGCGTMGGGLSCPTGASCRDFPGQSLCLDECLVNADCRTPDYACIQLGTDPNKVCWPVDPGSSNPNGEAVGGACGGDQDCDQGLTCLDFMGWPDGYCTRQFCDPQNNPCPTGSECYAFTGFFSLCLADCPSGGTQSTCRNEYYCLGAIGQPGGCVPN